MFVLIFYNKNIIAGLGILLSLINFTCSLKDLVDLSLMSLEA